MPQKARKNKTKTNVENLPQNPHPCMIVPDVDELWNETKDVSSTGMS